MRTTLNVDDDVLSAVKSMAEEQRTSAGKILSGLARQALRPERQKKAVSRNGFTLLPSRKGQKTVTLELINRLRDEEA